MKTLNESFNDDEFQRLQRVKGSRSWRKAILQEFGVNDADTKN